MITINLKLQSDKLRQDGDWADDLTSSKEFTFLILIEEFMEDHGYHLIQGERYYSRSDDLESPSNLLVTLAKTFPQIASAVKDVHIERFETPHQ
jgi:hypothetical protein